MLKNNKAEQLDNLFLEPNLIILIFVISHWLLIGMKAFGGEPKGQVPQRRQSPASTGSSSNPAQEEGPVPSPKAVSTALPDPRQLVCTISFS